MGLDRARKERVKQRRGERKKSPLTCISFRCYRKKICNRVKILEGSEDGEVVLFIMRVFVELLNMKT